MLGGNIPFNSDCLSFKDCSNVLISFWYKKKRHFKILKYFWH